MNHGKISPRDYQILQCLSCIPQKMLSLHGSENTSEFVLHELCGNYCFNFPKAAYFVDNPDFNCCKGVAGCCATERFQNENMHWHATDSFSKHMKQASFNQRVRQMHGKHIGADIAPMVQEFARQLEIEHPGYYLWKLKNGNNGLLVFDHEPKQYEEIKPHLESGLSLLGFCPVF